MNFRCEMSEAGDYVHARLGHPITIELVRAFVAEATRVGDDARREGGISRNAIINCLLDVRGARNMEPAANVFWFFREELPRIPRLRSARIAVLVDASDESHRFVETTSANAGYALHCFAEEQRAVDWLRAHS